MTISGQAHQRTFALAQGRLAALAVSAVLYLGAYELSTLWGRSQQRAVALLQRWSRRACALLGVDVHVQGRSPSEPCIYVSNHRSYVDIPVLAGALGARFLSRADIASWPVVGSAARATGTVFVDRDDPYGRAQAARELAHCVESVVVFPEGTTLDDRLPRAFQTGVFRLVHRLDRVIVPVTIRYSDRRAYWTDDSTIPQHLRARVLVGPRLVATVHVGQAVRAGEHRDSNSLAETVYREICRPIEELGELVSDT